MEKLFVGGQSRRSPLRWLAVAIALIVAIVLVQPLLGTGAIAQQPVTLTVSAGAGLKDVMEQVKATYQQQQPATTITYNFAASGVLQRQIEQGAKVDILISATTEGMDDLQSQGLLLPETRRNLLQSRIALIVPADATGMTSFRDLGKATVKKIAIGEPRSVPLGKYAEAVFNYFRLSEQVKPKLIYARSALEIMTFVESGNVDAGIVHDTNAKQSQKVKLVAIAPPASHTPVIYPVAVLKNSKNITPAKAFVQFLSSSTARKIFEQAGYQIAR